MLPKLKQGEKSNSGVGKQENISVLAGNMPLGVVIVYQSLNVKRPRPQVLRVPFVCDDVIKMAAMRTLYLF